jgi:heme-degrading monooxygenase HmoA
MTEVWTHGTWTAKSGQEDQFVAAWKELADWTIANYPGARGTLLRDRERTNMFVSFGPWPDLETAQAWRASDGFRERVARIQQTIESFEPRTLDLVTAAS